MAAIGRDRTDVALTCGGIALAVGLSLTAGAMAWRDDRTAPRIYGTEHLAVFAQPARLHDARVREQEARIAAAPATGATTPRGLDYAPTAVIAPSMAVGTTAMSAAGREQSRATAVSAHQPVVRRGTLLKRREGPRAIGRPSQRPRR